MAFQKLNIQAAAVIDKIDFVHIVGRKDRGIEKPTDLAGKRIKTTKGTVIDFYLQRFLELNGVDKQGITLVDIQTTKEAKDAIQNGDVDATIEVHPTVDIIVRQLGSNAVVWRAQSSQPAFTMVIARKQWIASHPDTVSRFLKSLMQAEDYSIHNPAQAKAIIQIRLNVDAVYVETAWSQNQFGLSLDQPLILAMEDEAR